MLNGLFHASNSESDRYEKDLIRHDALPKTVGDAILITRDLEIRYIWVDSQCIIQDSEDNWARECEVMGIIMRDLTATLLPTAASSNDEGCIFARNPNSFISIRVLCVEGIRPPDKGLSSNPWVSCTSFAVFFAN